MQAGIPLLDAVGSDVMDDVRDGERIEVRDGALWRDGEKIAVGEMLAESEIETRMEEARRDDRHRAASRSRATRSSTSRPKPSVTFEPLELPPLQAEDPRPARARRGARATTTSTTCKALRPYIREYQPVLIAVDGGADALLDGRVEARHHHRRLRLAVAIRRMHCGAELVHHVHPDGRAPGRENARTRGRRVRTSSSRRA